MCVFFFFFFRALGNEGRWVSHANSFQGVVTTIIVARLSSRTPPQFYLCDISWWPHNLWSLHRNTRFNPSRGHRIDLHYSRRLILKVIIIMTIIISYFNRKTGRRVPTNWLFKHVHAPTTGGITSAHTLQLPAPPHALTDFITASCFGISQLVCNVCLLDFSCIQLKARKLKSPDSQTAHPNRIIQSGRGGRLKLEVSYHLVLPACVSECDGKVEPGL